MIQKEQMGRGSLLKSLLAICCRHASPARVAPGGFVYHALNRAVARLPLNRIDSDYEAFGWEMIALEKVDALKPNVAPSFEP